MQEVWKDIEGYEGLYQVSNLGRVKSLRTMKYSHKEKRAIAIMREKILKPFPNTDKYLMIDLKKDGKRNCQKIHTIWMVIHSWVGQPVQPPQRQHMKTNNL